MEGDLLEIFEDLDVVSDGDWGKGEGKADRSGRGVEIGSEM
jgi:hypothetical protein